MTRVISNRLFGGTTTDVSVFVLVPLLLVVVAIRAIYFLRAGLSKVDPIIALRNE